jgi:hypothetical protein
MTLSRVNFSARPGFTFVELCMGLLVCSLIFSAVAAFSLAMGRSWQTSETTQASGLRTSQIMLRLQSELRGAKAVLYCQSGSLTSSTSPAQLFIWKTDNVDATSQIPDGKMQYSELELIEFSPPTSTTTGTINTYQSHPAAGADSEWYTSFCSTAAGVSSFKSGLTATTLATHIDGMTFNVQNQSSTTQAPVIETALLFKGNGQMPDKTRYGTVTLRSPANAPAN